MRILFILGAPIVALSLGGCVHQFTPEQLHVMFTDFAAAGCKGRAHGELGASTGQLGGEAHVSGSVDGDCDPANAKPSLKVGDTVAAQPPT
jgi:hypothetical protein